MALGAAARRLLGRSRERAVLDRLPDDARQGHGGVMVLHGDPGIGKTALLDYAVEAAPDFRVIRTAGVEGEMELAFAALQQLCSPILGFIDHLPAPQRAAMEVALGLSAGGAPNPFLVGLAALNLLSEAAQEQPLLCVVDDAQWLDRASARVLGFVARRLLAERIVIVFGARQRIGLLAGLPELHVEPLGRRDARTLLDSFLPGRLDERVLERIVAETRGNPLALLELPRGLTPGQLAGGFGLAPTVPLSTGIEQSFTRRMARMPPEARLFVLLAAAEPLGDPALLSRAAKKLALSEEAARAVEREGLLTLDGAVMFRHPLVRSAVYGAAEPEQRRKVHRALAEATDPRIDPDRRTWHRALAASAPDEDVASELERSAARAQSRGGFAAAAAFRERAATLTPEEVLRSRRALAAATAKLQAGLLDDALRLLTTAESGPLNELEKATAGLVRAEVAFVSTRGSDASPLLLDAAERLREVDPELARETYLEALSAAIFAGPLAGPGASSPEIAQAAKAAPSASKPRAVDLLLDGLVALLTDTYARAVPMLRETLQAFGRGMSQTEELRWMWGGTISAMLLWDDERWERLADRHLQLVRATGALGDLPVALGHRGQMHVFAGELASAASFLEAFVEAAELTGGNFAPYHGLGLVAMRGREAEATRFIDNTRAEVVERGEGAGLSFIDWAQAVLYNGLGRYADALDAANRVVEHAELVPVSWVMPELIEAAVRAGARELAAATDQHLMERSRASGTDWALGLAARSHALLADNEAVDDLFGEAIERLSRTRIAVDLARAHLLYGEWLRRQPRRMEARKQLRTAHQMFTDFGMEAFAERARVELEASGEHARRRTIDTLDQLTPQEAQIAHLVARGSTNREIAAELFISTSTVEYHLHKAFRKLGVRSRTELARRVGS